MILPGIGFAQSGPQRDAGLAAMGIPREVYTLYVLAAHHGRGHGRALLSACLPPSGGRASVLALVGTPAPAFYQHAGARLLAHRPDPEEASIIDAVLVWDAPDLIGN